MTGTPILRPFTGGKSIIGPQPHDSINSTGKLSATITDSNHELGKACCACEQLCR
jgi:hypothetical protein